MKMMIQFHTLLMKMKTQITGVFLALISSKISVMCKISAKSATVRGGESTRSRKRNQSEVGKRKTERDLR